MRIEYSFKDIVDKHYSPHNSYRKDEDFIVEDLAKRYEVHNKTVKALKKNDRVPEKYILMGE